MLQAWFLVVATRRMRVSVMLCYAVREAGMANRRYASGRPVQDRVRHSGARVSSESPSIGSGQGDLRNSTPYLVASGSDRATKSGGGTKYFVWDGGRKRRAKIRNKNEEKRPRPNDGNKLRWPKYGVPVQQIDASWLIQEAESDDEPNKRAIVTMGMMVRKKC